MKNNLKLLIFPATTMILIWVGTMAGGRSLQYFLKGQKTPGQIVAMCKIKPAETECVIDLGYELLVEKTDGSRIEAVFDYPELTQLTVLSAEGTPLSLDPAAQEEWSQTLSDLADWKSDEVVRFLQRENAKSDEHAVRIVKTERARLIAAIEGDLQDIIHNAGTLQAVVTGQGRFEAADAIEQITTIEFQYIGGTELGEKLKTDVQRTVQRTLSGQPVERDDEFFIFQESDHRILFRPVFSYSINGQDYMSFADVGSRMQQPKNSSFGQSMTVSYMPGDEANGLLAPDYSAVRQIIADDGGLDALNMFFKITFSRWFFALTAYLIAIAHLMYALLFISLKIWPAKTENADTVDEATL